MEFFIELLEERIAPTCNIDTGEGCKCNSGGGNGSEGAPDCDPGNSGLHNNGKD